MAATLDEANVEKKFRGVSQTQESIQSLTLWVIHHKAQHEKIVELWFRVLKKSKMSHRLTMFYLCNEIVQTCKRKHAIIFKDAYKDVLKDAVLLVRDNEVRNAVERIFNIWEERGVYDGEFIEEITAILNNTKVRATINSKLLADFKPKQLMDLVTRMKRHDDDVEVRTRQLSTLRLDASNLEAVKLLKDRMQGKEFCQQFEDSCTKLEKFVGDLEKGIKDRASLIEMLEQSELFYDTQYGEAKIVANAYKNFGSRVNNLRKKLEEHMKLIDNPLSPVPSPSMDAPSPGNTPPHLEDNIQMIDMEMSDEEGRRGSVKNKAAGGSLVPPGMLTAEEFFNQLQSTDPPIVLPFQTTTRSGMGQESTLPWTVPPPLPPTTSAPSNSSNLVHLTEGNTTPTADEGSSTPVQDEKPDANMSNPIEFLTQLINQSNKSQTGANASFFDSLTSLSKKVTTEGKAEEVPVTSTEINEAPTPGLDTPLGLAAPVWEPWTSQPETPTPSYVPDTRPTPTMPFGEHVPHSQPYTTDNLTQNHSFIPDSQGHLYAESQPPSEPYTVDSQPAPQPYILDPKSAGEQYTLDNQPPPMYGSDTQPPLPPQPFGQGPPPPPPNFLSDQNYIAQDPDPQPLFTSAPPPPPSDPPTSDGPPPAQFPPSFYQENTHQAPSPDTPDSMPSFPLPVSSWGQPFSAPGFMPPADSHTTTQDGQPPYLPPPSVSSASVQPPSGQDNAPSTFTLPPGAPPASESPQFSMPPGQPPQEHPPQFSMPAAAPTDHPLYGMPPGQATEPPPFNMGQPPPEPPTFIMANPPPDPPPFGLHQGAPDNDPFNMAPGHVPPHDHHPYNANQGPGPQSPYNIAPGQNSSDGAFNMPTGNPRDPPSFNLPHSGTGGCDPPPFCNQQDHPPFSGPLGQHGQGSIKSLFDVPPSPQFKRNSPPRFNRRSSGSGPGDGPPFNRGSQSGLTDQHDDYRHRGQHPSSHVHDGPPVRGILRHSRQNNLTTIQPHELDSPGSNSDQDSTDVSSISTMIGKGRMGPPRPPSQPPTPPVSGPTGPRGQSSNIRDDDDRQEFIEKLKRKKVFPPSIPAAPPKGILKNTSGTSNLRSLTEIPPDCKSDESVRSLPANSSAVAGETNTKSVSEAKPEEPKSVTAVSLKEDCSQVTDMEVEAEADSNLSKNESKPEQIQVRGHHFDHRPNSSEHVDRRRSFDSPHRGDQSFSPFADRRGGHVFNVREPRFGPRRPRFEHNFRDDYGQPFPKRYPSPRFENRFRHQFPRY